MLFRSGFQKWRLHKGKMQHEQTYGILFKDKEYSAYDFAITPNGIFVATSQGLYLQRNDNSFSLLYPALDSPTAKAGMPHIIYNLCPYQQNYLFAASIDGLLRIDLKSGKISRLHKGEKVQYVQCIVIRYALFRERKSILKTYRESLSKRSTYHLFLVSIIEWAKCIISYAAIRWSSAKT